MRATKIVPPPRRLPESADAVVVGITRLIESHYELRGAFPLLRRCLAPWIDADSKAVHYLTDWQARAIIADARTQVGAHDRSMTIAFRALIRAVEEALEDARARPALFAAAGPTLRRETTFAGEWWTGTRAQWLAAGLRVHGAWPGEPGGPDLARGQDDRGATAYVKAHSPVWPGLYSVHISEPPRRAAGAAALQRARADHDFQRHMAGLIAAAMLRPADGAQPAC